MLHVLDFTPANGVPMRAVIPSTEVDGKLTVTFYDRRHNFTPDGQHISDYFVATAVGVTGGINLYGGEPDWVIDATTWREEVLPFLREVSNATAAEGRTPEQRLDEAEAFLVSLREHLDQSGWTTQRGLLQDAANHLDFLLDYHR